MSWLGSPPPPPLTDEELLVANDFFLKAADKKRKAELLAAIKQVGQPNIPNIANSPVSGFFRVSTSLMHAWCLAWQRELEEKRAKERAERANQPPAEVHPFFCERQRSCGSGMPTLDPHPLTLTLLTPGSLDPSALPATESLVPISFI